MDGFHLAPKKSSTLRLVFPDQAVSLEQAQARAAVEAENRRAATLASGGEERAADVRQIFALRVGQMLEGGRAAIIPPDRRRRLVDAARQAGLRPFEANLIIAIVQDSARRGQPPAGAETGRLIHFIPVPKPSWWQREETLSVLRPLMAAAALGILLFLIAVEWIRGS